MAKPPTGGAPSSQQGIASGNYKSRSRHPPKKEWDDGTGINRPKDMIPTYRLTEDKYAAGYIAGLKR